MTPGSRPAGSTSSSTPHATRGSSGSASPRSGIRSGFFRFEASRRLPARKIRSPAGGKPDPQAALAFGISQSARVLQHMLLEALHVDEAGRMVFDGALIHVPGGGKGSFNHRFAETTRHPSELEDQQYPVDFFPFTTTPETDPVTGARGRRPGTARAAGALPKLVYTLTSTEYWTRSASLLHTDVDGARDLPLAANARLYLLAGAQHGNWRAPGRGPYQNCGNSLDHRPPMRALLLALHAWATPGAEPPASVFPRLADGTLGPVGDYRRAFPAIPGLLLPSRNLRRHASISPPLREPGIADRQPPALGPPFITPCRSPMPTAMTAAASACPRSRPHSAATPAGTCGGPRSARRTTSRAGPARLSPFASTEAERQAAAIRAPRSRPATPRAPPMRPRWARRPPPWWRKASCSRPSCRDHGARGGLYDRLLRHRPDDPSGAFELAD